MHVQNNLLGIHAFINPTESVVVITFSVGLTIFVWVYLIKTLKMDFNQPVQIKPKNSIFCRGFYRVKSD